LLDVEFFGVEDFFVGVYFLLKDALFLQSMIELSLAWLASSASDCRNENPVVRCIDILRTADIIPGDSGLA
jgi:hypothetical protein